MSIWSTLDAYILDWFQAQEAPALKGRNKNKFIKK